MSRRPVVPRRFAVAVPLLVVVAQLLGGSSVTALEPGQRDDVRDLVAPGVQAYAPLSSVAAADPSPPTTGGATIPVSGAVWGWGENTSGNLGNGTTGFVSSPVQLPGIQGAVAAAGNTYAGYALDSLGDVWAWGDNRWGSLGDGTYSNRFVPGRVVGVHDVVTLAATGGVAFAIDSSGSVWAWGLSYYGESGLGDYRSYATPTILAGLPPVRQITTTDFQVAALTDSGEVWVWGVRAGEWVGDESSADLHTPTRVDGLSSIVSISAKESTLYAVASDGSVWAVGSGTGGSLGDGVSSPTALTPVQIPVVDDAVEVVATSYGAYAISTDRGVWAWGLGVYLDDPTGSTTNWATPFLIDIPSSVVTVVASASLGYALEQDGTVWAWGINYDGSLGIGTTDTTHVPVQVAGLNQVTALGTGFNTTVALRQDGTAWVWGSDSNSGLGSEYGSYAPIVVPTQIPGLVNASALTVGMYERWVIADGVVVATHPDGTPVEATTHFDVNSFSVSDDERTLTYDLDFFLDDFPEACDGACTVHLFDGDYKSLGQASIAPGGSAHFSGTDTIGGSLWNTPEEVATLHAYVSLTTGDPAATYVSQFVPIDFGWRSAPADGQFTVTSLANRDGTGYYTINVWTSSLGGNRDEVCGYVSPAAHCTIEVAIVGPDGSRFVIQPVQVDPLGQGNLTVSNVGTTHGLDLDSLLAGMTVVVDIHGWSGASSRYLRLGTLRYAPSTDLPLILAHGITGNRDGEIPMENTVRGSVPSLVSASHIVRTDTPATTSVWLNAKVIEQDARTLRRDLGVPAVNVIAHSKGGLDARAANFQYPGLIDTLGMLSTPNGGSQGADDLCALRHAPWWFFGDSLPEQGACDGPEDGLFDLQTSYVRDTFNTVVRDDSSKRYFDLGGSCTGVGCKLLDIYGLDCLEGGYGGDGAVCVTSAFWLASNFKKGGAPGGTHVALDPVFALQHSGMNTDPCPVLKLLSRIYPKSSRNNPWTDGGGPSCSGYFIGLSSSVMGVAVQPSPFAGVAAARLTANASLTTAELSSTPPQTVMNRQAIVAVSASPDAPFTMALDPEGQDTMGVVVFLVDGERPAISVLDAASNDTGATVTWIDAEDALGVAQAQIMLTGLAGQSRTLQIVSTASQNLGVQTLVSSPTTLATSVRPGVAAGTAIVSAVLAGAGEPTLSHTTVTTYVTDAGGATQAVALARDASSGTFTATLSLPTAPFVQIAIIASGPNLHRYAFTGIALPDGTGQIGVVHDDALVDLDADGTPDALRLPIDVDVTVPGDYTLVLDAVDAGGATASASGTTTLEAGAGVITVDMPLDRLITVGANGPLSLVNGLLVRGLDPQKVATAADLGTTGSYDTSTMLPTKPVLSEFTATATDADTNGAADTATFRGRISTPAAGTYELTARFEAPDGTFVDVDDTIALGAGMNPYSLELPVDPASHGGGTYALGGVLLTGVDDVSLWAFGHDTSLPIAYTPPTPTPTPTPGTTPGTGSAATTPGGPNPAQSASVTVSPSAAPATSASPSAAASPTPGPTSQAEPPGPGGGGLPAWLWGALGLLLITGLAIPVRMLGGRNEGSA